MSSATAEDGNGFYPPVFVRGVGGGGSWVLSDPDFANDGAAFNVRITGARYVAFLTNSRRAAFSLDSFSLMALIS
jgi:hypothetical protein